MSTTELAAAVNSADADRSPAAIELNAVVPREDLRRALQALTKVTPNRSPKPILECVHVSTGEGATLDIRGTDLETTLRLTIECDDERTPGAVVVHLRTLLAAVKDCDAGIVQLALAGGRLRVNGWRTQQSLPTESADEFPPVGNADWLDAFDIDAGELSRAISQTLPATDNESSRYALGGVLIEADSDGVAFVGTDGRRMHCARPAVEFGPDGGGFQHAQNGGSPILDARGAKALVAALKLTDDVATVAESKEDIRVSAPRLWFASRKLEGRYPRWRDVFPQRSGELILGFAADRLAAAVKAAAVATCEESRGVEFLLPTNVETTAELAAKSPTRGVAAASVEVTSTNAPSGEPEGRLAIMLDPRFVLDAVKGAQTAGKGANVSLAVVDGDRAALVNCPEARFSAVLMPLARDRS